MDLTIFEIASGVFLGGLGLKAFFMGLEEARHHDASGETMPVWALLCIIVPLAVFGVNVWLNA